MQRFTALTIASLAGLTLLGGAFAAGAHYGRTQAADDVHPLPAPTVALGPATVELPVRVESTEGRCPAYAFSAPDESVTGGPADANGFALGEHGSVHLTCIGASSQYGGLAGLSRLATEGDDTFAVAAPLAVETPLGTVLKIDQRMSHQDLTEWWVERNGYILGIGYLRGIDEADAHDIATVESVLASWEWR